MTLFLIAVLAVSIAGMTSLLVLKRWELTTGHIVGGRARPALGAFMYRMLAWVEHVLPGLAREWAAHALRLMRAALHRLAALLVVFAERTLEKTLGLLRRTTQVPQSDSQASAFLREVSAHKKQLLKSSRKRAIYEE